jgi:hypothetical protein
MERTVDGVATSSGLLLAPVWDVGEYRLLVDNSLNKSNDEELA